VIEQVPTVKKLTVTVETWQTLVVADRKVTANSDAPPVAETVYVAPETLAASGVVDVKVML
jgi:hypothetical protein